eukprot:jgi/Chlat1/8086/Chrsp75S07584
MGERILQRVLLPPEHADKPALVVTDGGPAITYKQLAQQVDSVAEQLAGFGLKKGDVVTLVLPNSLENVVVFLAVASRLGAVAAPLNATYTEEEFKFYIEDAESKAVVLFREEGKNAAAKAAGNSLKLPMFVAQADDKGVITLTHVASSAAPASAHNDLAVPSEDDEALFLHTSGTTSKPKGVPLSQKNLSISIKNIVATYELSPADRNLLVMPLFHVHGLMAALLATLASGGAVIIPSKGAFSASSFWTYIEQYSCTWYTAVPTIHHILLSRAKQDFPDGKHPPKLRFIRSCSAALVPAVLKELEEKFQAPVLEAYAMTEASHQMTSNPLPSRGPHKAGTVGLGTYVEVVILDDNNQKLPPGKVGEICIKGENVTSGYKNNPAANEAGFAGGYFHTGDQGFLDEEGYVTIAGRIKELINRGGEKISPLEVDAVLIAHPAVSEVVTFAAPDPKYGEVVNAGVVLRPGESATEADLREYARKSLASFKVPSKIYISDTIPRTATGKIQRRIAAEFFLKPQGQAADAAQANPASSTAAAADSNGSSSADVVSGFDITARALAKLGIKTIYGVIGIPVTQLATSAQRAGVRFISFRNEQAAGYAAGAAGYLTGVPGAFLTVSGPGVVHGLAGLSNATTNTFPLIMLSGSTQRTNVGKGGFQELDQPFCKDGQTFAIQKAADIGKGLQQAITAAVSGRPGGVYMDLPADVLRENLPAAEVTKLLSELSPVSSPKQQADAAAISAAAEALRTAKRPLVVIGKGAAAAFAETELKTLVESTGIPFLPTPMGKGVLPDTHPLSATAARSLVLANADVALVVGARFNWILHFGEAPRWSKDVKFVHVDIDPEEARPRKEGDIALVGHAATVVAQLNKEIKDTPFSFGKDHEWISQITQQTSSRAAALEKRLQQDVTPLDYHTALRVIRDALLEVKPTPMVVSEGANTMDFARTIIPTLEPRGRLDAGTWGTMGVGLGYAIAAATVHPDRLTVAIEGDSAFGFSGLEVEVLARYDLPVVVIIFNNGGIYGGDRRTVSDNVTGPGGKPDPAPTSFVEGAKYELIAEAFGAKGYAAADAKQLTDAVKEAFAARKPAVINVAIDPMAGTESGNMQSHN